VDHSVRAAQLGYAEVVLDTLPSMTAAQAIYRKLGFEPIPAYWNNLVPDIPYFGKQLEGAGSGAPTAVRTGRREFG
jgi:ribosomal protein S18 acetylase RimI-like enzyme